jgi:hypothetical protein
MSATHLYGIIPTGDEVIFDVAGIDDDDDRVYSVPHGDIAAVVSASPLVDYRGLKREQAVHYLVTHQRVVETVMRSFPVLPVKFGTPLRDVPEVRRLLARGETLFRSALREFAGLVQLEVVVLWNLPEVLREIGQEEAIAQAKSEVTARTATATITERIAIGQMVQVSLERHRAALRDRVLLPTLRDVALDVVVNPVMDDNMVANLALLVDQTSRRPLEQRLDVLDDEFGGRLRFRCVGPLPPYSFASVEVEAPSFEAVNDARQQLGLGEKGTPGEIKQVYRRLAGQWHPDHNPHNPEAETHMAMLNQAYNLLTRYAGSLMLAEENVRQAACRFDRETVEKTLLIAIRRQETLADGQC